MLDSRAINQLPRHRQPSDKLPLMAQYQDMLIGVDQHPSNAQPTMPGHIAIDSMVHC